MAYAITDLSHGRFQYIADNGGLYSQSARNVVETAANALGALTGAEVGKFPGKPRHMTFVATTAVTEASGKSYFPKRKVIYNVANFATLKAATLSIDGLQFTHVGGHTGEKSRSL